MNIQKVYLGLSANDLTGDTLRAGGFKINDNALELFSYGPARHRQASVIYKTLSGEPVFLDYTDLNVNLIAPFVGTIGSGFEQRGERNAPIVITQDELSAWTVPDDAISYLYIQQDTLTAAPIYGYSTLAPYKSQTSAALPVNDQHWFDTLYNQMYEWDGSDFRPVSRLFVGYVTASAGTIIDVTYYIETEESEYVDSAVDTASANLIAYTDLQTSATLVSAQIYADNSAKKYALIFG